MTVRLIILKTLLSPKSPYSFLLSLSISRLSLLGPRAGTSSGTLSSLRLTCGLCPPEVADSGLGAEQLCGQLGSVGAGKRLLYPVPTFLPLHFLLTALLCWVVYHRTCPLMPFPSFESHCYQLLFLIPLEPLIWP